MALLALILCASLAGQTGETPNELNAAAFADIAAVAPDSRTVVRYLSLNAVPPDDREEFIKTLEYVINQTSIVKNFYKPSRVSDALLRVDTSKLGWDVESRADKLKALKAQGIDTAQFEPDLWELFARDDIYFFADTKRSTGEPFRGWVDPDTDRVLRTVTLASKAVIRADWLLPRLLAEAKFGGYYSQARFHPKKEADLYKRYGVNEALVEADFLKVGGAVDQSLVGVNNRELQLIPSLYGYDLSYIWRTFDFNADKGGDKSVLVKLTGTAKHDGREIIGTTENGLHWSDLRDGQGNQVADVPPDIAQDKQGDPFGNVRETRVINRYKCIKCHDPANGIIKFDDLVSKSMLADGTSLHVLSNDPNGGRKVAKRVAEIEQYYDSGLPQKIQAQQASFSARVKALNGRTPTENANEVVKWVEGYTHDNVTLEQAAREAGRSVQATRILLRKAAAFDAGRAVALNRDPNPAFSLLAAGIPVRRGLWEASFAELMQADVYPWESH